ncbi:hypothetical protein ACH5RR_041505 [Cinchona calisaya]|uniref:Uncharacterized protein n=1 Tax=Cinchona calisaya TaxID=153742 RepID=A0ABD2XV05_9GENT
MGEGHFRKCLSKGISQLISSMDMSNHHLLVLNLTSNIMKINCNIIHAAVKYRILAQGPIALDSKRKNNTVKGFSSFENIILTSCNDTGSRNLGGRVGRVGLNSSSITTNSWTNWRLRERYLGGYDTGWRDREEEDCRWYVIEGIRKG